MERKKKLDYWQKNDGANLTTTLNQNSKLVFVWLAYPSLTVLRIPHTKVIIPFLVLLLFQRTHFLPRKNNRIFPRINYLWWKQVRPTYNYQGCKPNFLKGNQQSTKLCRQRVYFTHWGKMQCKCQHWVFVINMEQIIYVINSLCLLCKGYLIGPE